MLAASIFHLGEFTVAEAKAHLAGGRGAPVRPAVTAPGPDRRRLGGPRRRCGSLRSWRPLTSEAPTTSHNGDGDAAKLAITVLADRVLVQVGQAEGERRSRAGILIPATAQVSRRLAWAEAVAVGPHVRSVKVGRQRAVQPRGPLRGGGPGEEYVILRERDIHAVAATRIDGGTGLYL